jgi:hypothetical protein
MAGDSGRHFGEEQTGCGEHEIPEKQPKRIPRGLEPGIYFPPFPARMKACPDTSYRSSEFFCKA